MQEIVRPLLFRRVYASRASDLYLLVRALVGRAELGSTLTEVMVTTPHQAGEMAYSQQIAGIVEENLRIGDVWAPAWSRFAAGDRFAALASLLLQLRAEPDERLFTEAPGGKEPTRTNDNSERSESRLVPFSLFLQRDDGTTEQRSSPAAPSAQVAYEDAVYSPR
ncbi:hypothetical protein L209DRAFT_754719 [Thermothelomyces heterothallicus CBS 203.75]